VTGIGVGDIVFLGDSITEDAGWSTWFPDLPVHNHGVGGETSWEVLQRVPPIARARPGKVFLLVGTNDLRDGWSPADSAAITGEIVGRFKLGPALYLQSVLPREREHAGWVRALNARLEQVAIRHGATYLDLWPAFARTDGELRPELTYDRLHLSGAGYEVWRDQLWPYVTGGSSGG
jgi:lysophospholipase L1-like esterase